MELERFRFDPIDSKSLLRAAADFVDVVGTLDKSASLDLADDYLECLPADLRMTAHRLRTDSPTAGMIVSGVPLGGLDEVPTPRALGQYSGDDRSNLAGAVLFLLASAVGSPFCFASQQKGQVVLDVFPLAGHEADQLGCSSTTFLEWHNEDAFHPLRADFSALMCVRNGQAATTLVAVADLELDHKILAELRRPQFAIVPDVSHSYSYNSTTSGVFADSAFSRIAEMTEDLPRHPVLSGDATDPRICVDFAYMPPELHTPAANAALKTLQRAIDSVAVRLALTQGEILIFDNMRCVHGRESFQARYDGTDRWIRRMNIARDRASVERNLLATNRLQIS